MSQTFALIERGFDYNCGRIICRGDEMNLWWLPESPDSRPTLTEYEAQIEGLWMKPGTPLQSEVEELELRINGEYDGSLHDHIRQQNGYEVSLYEYLSCFVKSVPAFDTERRVNPFDIRRWV